MVLALLACAALVACGQDTAASFDPGKTAQWLADGDARHLAWAAESIAEDHEEALYPKLVRALHALKLSDPGLFSGSPDELAAEAVADAIIKTGLKVPSRDSRRLYPEFPGLAVILLSRASDDSSADLLDIFKDSKGGEVWLASANLLAENPKPEFVSHLIADFSVFVRILLFPEFMGGGMSYGDCYSQGRQRSRYSVPANWPKITMYSLHANAQDGVVFAPGKTSVAYAGSVDGDPLPWKGKLLCGGLNIESLRRDLLVQLAGQDTARSELQAVVLTNVTEQSDEQARQEILHVVQTQADAFRETVAVLFAMGLLIRADEKPHMDVMLVPFGKVNVPELPTLPSLGIVGDYRIVQP